MHAAHDPRPGPNARFHRWRRHANLYLLASLLTYLLIQPLLADVGRKIVFVIITTLVLITGVYAVGGRRRTLALALVLGVPLFIAIWTSLFLGRTEYSWIEALSAVAFFGYLTVTLLASVLRADRVTDETLFGAASVYLLIGVTWAFAYLLTITIDPSSISRLTLDDASAPFRVTECLYFSYVTLTTLGYGDIVPADDFARSLAVTEAVCGVLYLAFLVARLVALFRGMDKVTPSDRPPSR